MSLLRVAVVGVGALGRHHARILSELADVELVGVAETNPETGRRVADACRTRWLADYRELLGQIDAVSIVVPTALHLTVASDFLKRGIPTLIEKPLATTAQQGAQLLELARRHHALLQVGHVERFNPATQVASQLCGPPKYIRAERLSPYAFRSTDIGVVLDVMIHDLDLVLDLVRSPITRVEAFGVSLLGEHEDSVQARLQFENGCIADLTANRVSPTVRRTLQVWSKRGCVQADLAAREVVAYRPSEKLLFGKSPLVRSREPGADIEQLKSEIFGQYIEVLKPEVPAADALTAELRAFVDCVREKRQPLVSGEEAQRAMLAAEQVLHCVRTHQWDGCAAGAIGPLPQPAPTRKLAG